MNKYDFSGWATKVNLLCSDGRTILKDAFKHNDGKKVPLVWNHRHDSPDNIIGYAILEHRDTGTYTYCTFNDTERAKTTKLLLEHGDITQLSIVANQLKHQGSNVTFGDIKEVSVVVAAANPGAMIDTVMSHSQDSPEEATIYTGEDLTLAHADELDVPNTENPDDTLEHADTGKDTIDKKTIAKVYNAMTEEQQNVVHVMAAIALENSDEENGGNESMKHNIFDKEDDEKGAVLSHADQLSIITTARQPGVGSLQVAIARYAEDNKDVLQHGIDEIETLFPVHADVHPGAPELLTSDQGWIGAVMTKTHKSPISRIRTRQADARLTTIRAKGYKKGAQKTVSPNIKLLKRTTDPQTVYRKDAMHRDDIVDITDFDVVEYQYGIMKMNLNEEVATAIMIGDGRDDGDADKIEETHIRSVWHDDELYTIHADVDIEAAKAEIQGSGTDVNFGENYIYAEAIIAASLYAREDYKGTGNMDFYCTPHLLNVMLLARDMNGRRIYSSKTDLVAALNVNEIYTAEQFEGRTRVTTDTVPKTKKLLGLFVNLADYQIGSTKGGEITRFNQFDIDFNQEKYLIETRISGALTRVYSAIALEEDVTAIAG
jgi:hypothetical protein